MNKGWLLSVAFLSNATLATANPSLIDQQTAFSEQLQELIGNPSAKSSDIETLTQQSQALADQIKKEALEQPQQEVQSSPTTEQPKETPTATPSTSPQDQSLPNEQAGAPSPDATSTPTQDPSLPNYEQQQQVLHKAITNLFDGFVPNLLHDQDKVLLEEQKLLLTTLEKSLPQILAEGQETQKTLFESCIGILVLLCTLQKEIQAKTELLATNLLEKPLAPQQVFHLQIKALQNLCNHLRQAWPHLLLGKTLEAVTEKYFNNKHITQMLTSLLPAEFPVEHVSDGTLKMIATLGLIKIYRIYRACISKQAAQSIINDTIAPLIACEITTDDSTIFNEYAHIMKQYRTGSYGQPGQMLTNFLNDLQQTVENYEKKRQDLEKQDADENPYFTPQENSLHQNLQKILGLLSNKLLSIKNEVLTLQPEITDPTKAGIWIRYQVIALNPITQKLITQNNEFSKIFNGVQKSILYFTSANDFSPQAVREMLFVMNKLQKFLKYNEKSATHKIIFNPDDTYTLMSEMASLLEQVCANLLQKTQDPFVREILTFALIEPQSSSEEPMSPGKKIIVEAAQQITGQKFNSFRDVFLYTMCYISPWLAAYVLSWALPYLGEEIKKPIVDFFAQQKTNKQPITKESLTPLVTPNLLGALEKLGPEIATNALINSKSQVSTTKLP